MPVLRETCLNLLQYNRESLWRCGIQGKTRRLTIPACQTREKLGELNMEIIFRKIEPNPQREAELHRMAHYMRTGHLRPNPELCRHGIDIHGKDICRMCSDPIWARICPTCNAPDADPLTMDGFLCRSCHKVYVVDGNSKCVDGGI